MAVTVGSPTDEIFLLMGNCDLHPPSSFLSAQGGRGEEGGRGCWDTVVGGGGHLWGAEGLKVGCESDALQRLYKHSCDKL